MPENDIYGALYRHILFKLDNFVGCCHVLAKNASDIPVYLETLPAGDRYFDRIEVSNIVDQGFLGLEKTLTRLGPWLKATDINPHATSLTFLNKYSIRSLEAIRSDTSHRALGMKDTEGHGPAMKHTIWGLLT